ncbi:MAG: hypothetical protein R3174_09700 [Gammaproteobacteria bacterium]|nr:hypothetical protein [Gammaproteobacteria bacterium]
MNAMTATAEILDRDWQTREADQTGPGVHPEANDARTPDRDRPDLEIRAWAARARGANGFGG